MAIRKELATELKDLDVDRVDGVDRPATGRSFALYKSETITKEDKTMTEITKDELQALLKNYASVATAADLLVKALRASKSVTKSVAIAANGMAQILGGEPVVKAVPGIANQPYEIEDPMRDENARGPADEKIGANFTPRSMPGSMVGKVQFSIKGTAKAAPAVDPEDAADGGADEATEGKMPWMKALKAQGEQFAAQIEGLKKALTPAPVVKVEKTEGEVKKPVAPESKQVMTDEQRAVRKSAGYRFGEDFTNVVFTERG